MQNREVELEIDEAGNVQVSVKGVPGPGCLQLTQDVEHALGRVTESQKTSEFQAKQKPKQKLGG